MIRRRRVLKLALGAVTTLLALPLRPTPPPGVPGLTAAGLDAAARLGRRYLLLHPERDFEEVEALLAAREGQDPWRGVRRCIVRDFEHELVVVVDGWVLSRTEARLCAYLTLAHGLA